MSLYSFSQTSHCSLNITAPYEHDVQLFQSFSEGCDSGPCRFCPPGHDGCRINLIFTSQDPSINFSESENKYHFDVFGETCCARGEYYVFNMMETSEEYLKWYLEDVSQLIHKQQIFRNILASGYYMNFIKDFETRVLPLIGSQPFDALRTLIDILFHHRREDTVGSISKELRDLEEEENALYPFGREHFFKSLDEMLNSMDIEM